MANYATLKAAIQQVVKTNGNNEITGALLQQSLLAMVSSLGAGFQYMGVATPATNPGTPDQNVFYLAATAGTYSNFGSIVLSDGEVAILKYNGSWSKDATGFASEESLAKFKNQISLSSSLSLRGYIDHTYGSFVDANNYVATPMMSLEKNHPLIIKGGTATSGNLVSFYDRNQDYISGINQVSEIILSPSDFPANAEYFRVSTQEGTKDRIWCCNVDIISLFSRLRDVENILGGVGVTCIFSRTGYFNYLGNHVPTASGRNTGLIRIPPECDTIHYKTNMGSAGNEIGFFDENQTYLTGVRGNSVTNERTIDLTDSAYAGAVYFCVSVYNSAYFDVTFAYCYNSKSMLARFSDQIDNISTRLAGAEANLNVLAGVGTIGFFTKHGYYRTNGSFTQTDGARSTELLPIFETDIIISYKTIIASAGCEIAFFDENLQFISGIPGNTTMREETIDLTDPAYANAKFFSVSVYGSAYFDQVYAYCYAKGSILQQLQDSKGAFQALAAFTLGATPLKILIFGDSITDCANLTIGSNNRTTAYTLRHPSNSYVDAGGHTISYDMWPYLLTKLISVSDLRNYARSGAHYVTRPNVDDPRQNLAYQIEVALNDRDNPNNVFPTRGTFNPDIIIFALGTNDGAPNDTFDSAMAKTIMNQDGTAFDVDATIANLDLTKFNEAARYAFMKIKQAFPNALTFCVLPIQRTAYEIEVSGPNSALRQMAERYSIIVIDGASNMGIVRDFEVQDGLGQNLKDGLHPNDRGQNLFARLVATELNRNFVDMSLLNP